MIRPINHNHLTDVLGGPDCEICNKDPQPDFETELDDLIEEHLDGSINTGYIIKQILDKKSYQIERQLDAYYER